MNKKIFDELKSFFKNDEDLQNFINTPNDDLFIYHYGFGTWIRNKILYPKEKFLKECSELGISADDLSTDMIINFYYQLKYPL